MNPLLVDPSLLIIMGTTIGLLWLALQRQQRHLALIGAGFVLFAVGIAVQLLHYPAELRQNSVVSAAFYALGSSAFALGVIRRSDSRGGILPLCALSVLIVSGIAWYAYGDRNLTARIYVLNFGLGLILLYAAWRTRHYIRGTMADRILFWSVLGTGLQFFPRTMLTIRAIANNMSVEEFNSSIFWQLSLYVMGVFSAIMGLAIVIVTGLDVIACLKNERDTDPLTGIPNRRAIDRIFRQFGTLKHPVSMLVCDVDHFKRINDTYGHYGGDIVLQHFVRRLAENVRPGDIIGRLGGEEFVVIMPGTSLAEAALEAERIRSAHLVMGPDTIAPGLAVRVSIGVVEIGSGEDPWSAMRRGDMLLYEAKKKGRNRVVSEPSEEELQMV